MKAISPLSAALIPAVFVAAQVVDPNTGTSSDPPVVKSADVEWGALNPARGKLGPRAGNLWGDRTTKGATGFLVKFADGFSSPPHIHNVTYRGIVISGLVHNDDPNAAVTWMPAGSFWTQPAGEVHITAAKGENVVAYIEISEGPYLVLPTEEAFDRGERPVNIDASNIVWLDASATTWIKQPTASPDGPKLAFLWGDPLGDNPSGTVIKLPAGFKGTLRSKSAELHAVVIQGRPGVKLQDVASLTTLDPGSSFNVKPKTEQALSLGPDEEATVYVRTDGKFELIATSPTE